MKFIFSYLVIYLCVFCQVTFEINFQEKKSSQNTFIPTNEWRIIEEGERIPRGIHVRINLETGLKEGKLLDETEKSALSVTETISEKTQERARLLQKEIEEALKKIKGDEPKEKVELKKFRTYEQLKEELADLSLVPKTDSEVMNALFKDYLRAYTNKDEDAILRITEDFEYLGHQYDNAIEFINQGGFQNVIFKNLNTTNDEIRSKTFVLLGSLAQNNPKVQIHCLEMDCLNKLLRFTAQNVYQNINVKIVHAFGSIMRKFPLAQEKFIENGGLSVLINYLQSENIQLVVKVIILFDDLINEHLAALDHLDESYKKDQYDRVNIRNKLLDFGYCTHLNNVLSNIVSSDINDYSYIEAVLIAVNNLCRNCTCQFNLKSLTALRLHLEKNIEFTDLKDLMQRIAVTVHKCDKIEL